ncbi:PQQ-dependent sugar dehydrogenase [Occallatibacter riparius]|uniref:Sorbosone dehydrogenase family protein n=1 Tax=Occallatibacter riparius TaxID=1002689 RepID=A0A9J7BV61_9BACT|nr:sorbosone dehydrogenase family protein [Occallatibacter riparius]UWZ86559.1 sorbosone dehydrogenase family protein [Occallatibacter riparius]
MHRLCVPIAVLLISSAAFSQPEQKKVLTGQNAFTDAAHESPGTRRHLTTADLPGPKPDESVDNGTNMVPRPPNAWPQAPKGFKVELYATNLDNPRLLRTAPNGDIFLAESETGKIRVFRGVDKDGHPQQTSVFAEGLHQPFGIAFYPNGDNPQYILVGDTDAIIRFPYHNGDLKATGPMVKLADLPGGGRLRGGGHWTRDLVFSKDGTKLFASVGSHSNVDDPDTHPEEKDRADVLEFTPDGKFVKVYAYGIRNCVGEAINPTTGQLWCSTNERDAIGNNLVPDYVTHIKEGGFYGWPYYWMGTKGGVQDPRHKGKHPELQSKVITPDVLVNPHMASLEMTFYEGSQFPAEFKGDAFAAEHGSWNRAQRTGYEVIRIPMKNGKATGEYEDFLTGFTLGDGNVWGRPVGVTVAKDGSLFVSDDGTRSIWHVSYVGK